VRNLLILPAFLLTVNGLSGLAAGQSTATTIVTANPGTIAAGSAAAITATVQPSTAPAGGKTIPKPTGTVTFLDGTTPLTGGTITLAPNGLASATFPQTFGTPDPTLTAQATITYTGELVGDLNGDGVQDLLIYNPVAPFSVQTFTSGKGGYNTGAVQTFNFVGGCSSPPQLIDLNGDGKTDLLCGTVVAHGNGDGTFAQAASIPFLSSGFDTTYAADLNGDGKTDILAVPPVNVPALSPFQPVIAVFLNQGGGSFTSAGTFPVAAAVATVGFEFLPPIVADVNDDGKPDLIAQTLTYFSTGASHPQRSIDVLLNNGDGTFGTYIPVTISEPANLSGGPSAYNMAAGDVNGDGKQDLILTEIDTAANLDAIVLLGNGDGTFQSQQNLILNAQFALPLYQFPTISVEDLNSDGKQDLIFGNGQVALGNGDGTFVLSTPLFTYLSPGGPPSGTAFSLAQIVLPGNLTPSLVYLLATATPAAVSVFTPQTSSSATLSPSALAVGTHSITARYSGDANYTADSSAAVAVTVNQAASATAVSSSANPGFAGEKISLTATITGPGPMPTGNVTFTSGSTALGTVVLSGGSAVFTTSSFTTPGTQTITVSYSGDVNTQASSTSLNQVMNAAFTLSPDGGSNTTLTVKAGQTVTAPINVTGAAGFSGTVSFACSGLPANTSCSFSPATANVSGASAVPTLLTVNTAGNSTTSQLMRGFGAYGVAFAGLILFLPLRGRSRRVWAMMIAVCAFAAFGLSGCSGSGSGSPPAAKATPGTYPFTVTASLGNVQTQSAYTLVVQ
jgi:Bacterial Ig-like domain (group 3)/FG-GAP-like repeat/FG-GAP repeat